MDLLNFKRHFIIAKPSIIQGFAYKFITIYINPYYLITIDPSRYQIMMLIEEMIS